MQAYVFVQTEPGNGRIAADLRAVPGIVHAEDLQGPYDAIALAGYDPAARPLEKVIAEIREVPGVVRTISAALARYSRGIEDEQAA